MSLILSTSSKFNARNCIAIHSQTLFLVFYTMTTRLHLASILLVAKNWKSLGLNISQENILEIERRRGGLSMVTGRRSASLLLCIHFQPPPLGGDPGLWGLGSAFYPPLPCPPPHRPPHTHTSSLLWDTACLSAFETSVCVEFTHCVTPPSWAPVLAGWHVRIQRRKELPVIILFLSGIEGLDSPKQMSYALKTSLGWKSFPREQHNFLNRLSDRLASLKFP